MTQITHLPCPRRHGRHRPAAGSAAPATACHACARLRPALSPSAGPGEHRPGGFPPSARARPAARPRPRRQSNLAPAAVRKARCHRLPAAPRPCPERTLPHARRQCGPRTAGGGQPWRGPHHMAATPKPGWTRNCGRRNRHGTVVARRVRLNSTAFDLLPWLPPAFAARLRADTATELQPWLQHGSALRWSPPPRRADRPGARHGHPSRRARDHRRGLDGRSLSPPAPRPPGRAGTLPRRGGSAGALGLPLSRHGSRCARPCTRIGRRNAKRSRTDADLGTCHQRPPPRWRRSGRCRTAVVPGPDGDATFTQNAQIEISRTNPYEPSRSFRPAGLADGPDKILMQRGTVAGRDHGRPSRPEETSAKTCIQTLPPGACPGGGACTTLL